MRDDGFERCSSYLQQSRGFDFTAYKRTSLERRIQKRMQAAGIESYSGYTDYLEAHPSEFTQLFNTILINVTAFFRDPRCGSTSPADIIPRILQSRRATRRFASGAPGCSSGEEAYSLAMLLAEALGPEPFANGSRFTRPTWTRRHSARAAPPSYADKAVDAIPKALLNKYFERVGRALGFPSGFPAGGDLRPPRPDPGSADFPPDAAGLPEHADVLQL